MLAPTLQPGDIVDMDNIPAHKPSAVCQANEAAGAESRFLSTNSPDFNPIKDKQAFDPLHEMDTARRRWRRNGFLKTRGTAQKARRENGNRTVGRYRSRDQSDHTKRMPKLLASSRLGLGMIGKYSSVAKRNSSVLPWRHRSNCSTFRK